MQKTRNLSGKKMLVAMVCALALLVPQMALAHCDALDGPVIIEARNALEKGDVTPILKWVMPEYEEEVRRAFSHTTQVRGLSDEARELADLYFFETLVRVHRAGEGAAYTGIKPAGSIPSPIARADQALLQGSVDELADHIADHVGKTLRERFAHTMELRKNADAGVDEGREFVAAYVDYMHFVEGIVAVIRGDHAH